MSNKVLMIVGDASETLDTMYPFYRLQEAGFQPIVAAPEKRLYQMVMHEVKPGWTITKHFFETGKPIASVCHGVEIPAYTDCVKGRRMATVPKYKFDLEVCGGTFVDEPCVIDGNLVSGRTFHDNGHYVGPWIQLLEQARDRG